jgi:hypothetical protein
MNPRVVSAMRNYLMTYYSSDAEEPFVLHIINKPGESGNVGRMHPFTFGEKNLKGKSRVLKM